MATHGVARTSRTRTEDQRLQDLERIKTYRDLENEVRAHAASGAYDLALFQHTTKLLRLNPEHYTVWNIRRRCLLSCLMPRRAHQQGSRSDAQDLVSDGAENQQSDRDVLQSELTFTMPLLIKFPKSYWIWNFRRWVLSQCIRLPVPVAREMWEAELDLVSRMLDKDPRNFHGWGYRRFVVSKLESPQLTGKSMAEEEFAYTTKMIRGNLSNFSAWHNRSQLIPRVLDERGADDKTRAAFLADELVYVRGGLDCGPEDQSLWFYHQFLISHIVHDHGDQQTMTPALTADERAAYLIREIDEIKDLLADYTDTKWIYQALLEYTLALERLQGRAERYGGDVISLRTWLAKLRALDPMRLDRWNDVERETGL